MNFRDIRLLIFIGLSQLISSCMLHPEVQTKVKAPTISKQFSAYKDLISLPEPRGRIPVAVYSFRDQTGQYKPQANVSSFSTAVTQGAGSILIQSLEKSKWFMPVEREGLQNILTERKIIRAAQKYKDEKSGNQRENELPPLQTASVILEGGIIAYDTNINTGGLSGAYYGFNTGELYRTDKITVYLRAADVRSGRVLASVSTSKTVFSQEIRTGFFRYVTLSRLAELEAGVSFNEPIYTCVLQAIQKAVVNLVIEGIDNGIWALKNQDDMKNTIIQNYFSDKQGMISKIKG